MAPPPAARRRCDRPVTAGRSTALKAALAPHQPGPGRRIVIKTTPARSVSRFASQTGTQARPTVLLHRPQGGGLSPITPLSTTPCDRRARSASLHILPADYALAGHSEFAACAGHRTANSGAVSAVLSVLTSSHCCGARAGSRAGVPGGIRATRGTVERASR